MWRQNADPFMCSCAGNSNEYLTFDAPERSRGHYGSLFSPLKKTLLMNWKLIASQNFSSLRSWNLKICNSRFWNNNLELPVMGSFFFCSYENELPQTRVCFCLATEAKNNQNKKKIKSASPPGDLAVESQTKYLAMVFLWMENLRWESDELNQQTHTAPEMLICSNVCNDFLPQILSWKVLW